MTCRNALNTMILLLWTQYTSKIAQTCHILLNSYVKAKYGMKSTESSEIRVLQEKLLEGKVQCDDSLDKNVVS